MKKYLGLFVGLALVFPMAAGAAEFRQGQFISMGETVRDNLYVAGGTLNLAGTVEGDLYVAGGTINISGSVTKDLVVAGGTVIINGRVGEDLRVMGGNVTLSGPVGGELVVAGGNIIMTAGADVTRGAYIASGTLSMSGSVGQKLVYAGGDVTLTSGAKVGGDFDYYSAKEAKVDAGAKISGATNFHQQQQKGQMAGKKAGLVAFFTIWWLLGIIAILILVYLLYYIWRKDSNDMIAKAFARPWMSLLKGFALLFLLPIAAIILFITVIGWPIGLIILFGYIAFMILAAAFSTILGAALLAKLFKRKETDLNWWLILIALVIMSLIKLIPIIGWIIDFIIFLAAIGVLGSKLGEKLEPQK